MSDSNVCLYFSVWARGGTELEREFSNVKCSSSYSAQPSAAASINTVNHWTGLPYTSQGTPPRTHNIKKKKKKKKSKIYRENVS